MGKPQRHSQKSHQIRLNKLIADSGLASRRQADRMIEDGEVTLNGKKVFELGVQVDPENDRIRVNGKPLPKPSRKYYLVINKPRGVLTSTSDPQDRPVITDLIRSVPARIFPVGRLDWDSEGLLIMTNDGELSNHITHPKEEITKTYLAKVAGEVTDEKLQRLLKGVTIVGGRVKAKGIERVQRQVRGKYSWIKIIITEGKNRQVRKMFEKINCDVMKLQRIAIGQLKLGKLKKGEFRELTPAQVAKVFKADYVFKGISEESNPRRRTKSKKVTPSRKKTGKKKTSHQTGPSGKKAGKKKSFKKKRI